MATPRRLKHPYLRWRPSRVLPRSKPRFRIGRRGKVIMLYSLPPIFPRADRWGMHLKVRRELRALVRADNVHSGGHS